MTHDEFKWAIFQELNRTGTALRPHYERDYNSLSQSGFGRPTTQQTSVDQLLKDVQTVFASLTGAAKVKRRK